MELITRTTEHFNAHGTQIQYLKEVIPPGPHAGDDQDILPTIDRWLITGHEAVNGLSVNGAIQQQCWPVEETRARIVAAWQVATGAIPGIASTFLRGHGWRVWYEDGSIYDSLQHTFAELPEELVLAVSYDGPNRWLAQGISPFWLNHDGLIHDSRINYPDGHINPRWMVREDPPRKSGRWVTNEVMRALRLEAVLAFAL